MDSSQAAKNLAEAAHALLDTSENLNDPGYNSVFVSRERMKALTAALDAYDERVAYEAGKPAATPSKVSDADVEHACALMWSSWKNPKLRVESDRARMRAVLEGVAAQKQCGHGLFEACESCLNVGDAPGGY